ncbi:MAG: hypothetical protein R3E01_13290 [Pirellulaceae bacterium]
MMGQIRVLMNARARAIADVTDHNVFGVDPWEFFIIDPVRILGQPIAGEHQSVVSFWLRRIVGAKCGQRRKYQDGEQNKHFFFHIRHGASRPVQKRDDAIRPILYHGHHATATATATATVRATATTIAVATGGRAPIRFVTGVEPTAIESGSACDT